MPGTAATAAPAETPSLPAPLLSLVGTVAPHFQEAQHSLANHRKNTVALHRVHVGCAKFTEQTPRGTKLVGEKAFNDVFLGCLNRLLGVKKGVTNADRGIKFVVAYAVYSQGAFRALARKAAGKPESGASDVAAPDDEEEDTPATRFVNILIKHLLRGFVAKNKNVRLRCCQAIALLINGLDAMDDDVYESLREALLLRSRDKESAVRVQAIIALAKMQAGDDDDDDTPQAFRDEDEDAEAAGDITGVLLDILRHDPSAEVRRAALFNLSPTARTLPYLLERLRDVDAINRRCVYLGTLSPAVLSQPGASKIHQRQWGEILKVGLGEREESVRRAAHKLIKGWVEAGGDDEGLHRVVDHFDLLQHPDVVGSALHAAFEVRPQLLDTVSFGDEFWANLSPANAIVGRVFVEHCKTLGEAGERRLEAAMPLVTALAFRTQAAWAALLEALEDDDAQAEAEEGSDGPVAQQLQPLPNLSSSTTSLGRQSILDSLLRVAMAADYGDEIGRRKMFGLVRDMISNPLLPEALLERSLDVLFKLSAGQRDFVRIVVELVQELGEWDKEGEEGEQDEDEDDEEAEVEEAISGVARKTPSPEEAARQAAVDARRLVIVRGMLERIASGLHENTAIHGIISQLIAPAVRSKVAVVREQGLLCLGLCCMLDAQLALQTFSLFIDQVQKAVGGIKLRAVQVCFDALLVHGIPFLCSAQTAAAGGGPEAEAESRAQIQMFLQSLLEDDELEVQAAAAEGIAKLMLTGVIESDDALRSLVLVYMSPETVENQELRQCLSYFLPVYCYSSSANQRRLQQIFVDVLQVLTEVYQDREEGQEMVNPMQVGLQLLDWTDHDRAVHNAVDDTIHADVGIDLMKALFRNEDKEERKVMVNLLGKLNLPDGLDEAKMTAMLVLMAKLQETNPPEDVVSKNALARFYTACAKRWPEAATAAAKADVANAVDLEDVRAFFDLCGIDLTTPAPPVLTTRAVGSGIKKVGASAKPTAGTKKGSAKSKGRSIAASVSDDETEDDADAPDEEDDETVQGSDKENATSPRRPSRSSGGRSLRLREETNGNDSAESDFSI